MTRSESWLLALAAVVATGTLAAGLGGTDLWPPNETRVAEISREMLVDGNWAVPRLNGEPFLEEPPLFYWLQAGLYRIARGPSAVAARVPATVGAILGVAITIALARAVGANGGIAALVLATAPEYWWMARTGTPDTANAAASGLALVALYAAWRSGSSAMLAVAVAAGALAFWLKSFLGVGLAAATALAFLTVAGLGGLRRRQLVCATFVLGALAGSWLLVLWRAEGAGGPSFFVITNHLGRLVGSRGQGHVRPFYYYAPNLALDLLPWSVALPASFVAAWKERRDAGRLFLLLWAGLMTVVLSASATKSAHYLLPAYPAFAVLVAQWWSHSPDKRLDRLTWSALGAVLLAFSTATLVATSLDPATIAKLVERGPDASATEVALHARLGGLTPLAGLVMLLGVAFLAGRPAHRPSLAAVAAATGGIVVHLLLVMVVLPAVNVVSSARPLGEALGRVARNGVDVFTYGFHNPEAVSPFMFYAGRTFREVRDEQQLKQHLSASPACALVRADAYAQLSPALLALPGARHTIGELGLVLVSSSGEGCPTARPASGPRFTRGEAVHVR